MAMKNLVVGVPINGGYVVFFLHRVTHKVSDFILLALIWVFSPKSAQVCLGGCKSGREMYRDVKKGW